MDRFCKSCGAPRKEGDKACPYCRTLFADEVKSTQTPPAPQPINITINGVPQPSEPTEEIETEEQPTLDDYSNRRLRGCGCLSTVVMFIFIGFIIYISSTTGSTASTTTTPKIVAATKTISEKATSTRAASEQTTPSDKKETTGQKNAKLSAKSYLEFSSFSYTGLIQQLEFEGYTHEEATYAADSCGADWYAQAVLSAKSYLEFSSFSRKGLIDQLVFEGFTKEQAEYAATEVGY